MSCSEISFLSVRWTVFSPDGFGLLFAGGVSTFLMRLRFFFASSAFLSATGVGVRGFSTGSSILPKTVSPDRTVRSALMVSGWLSGAG